MSCEICWVAEQMHKDLLRDTACVRTGNGKLSRIEASVHSALGTGFPTIMPTVTDTLPRGTGNLLMITGTEQDRDGRQGCKT